MRPNIFNYCFAHSIPIAALGGAAILSSYVLFETTPLLRGIAPISALLAIIASIPLGMALGYFVLGLPLFLIGRFVNGGPFQEGDWVRILVGPHKGQATRVYQVWSERNQIRVDLGVNAGLADVFFILHVCREDNPPR